MASLIDRYAAHITGVLSCYDRVIIRGTLPGFCYAEGMTSFLKLHNIRIFDYPQWAEPLKDQIKTNAEALAQKHGLPIEFIRRMEDCRKEDRIQDILKTRGTHPGLVHIFSALETCSSYQPWHNKTTGQTYLRGDGGKCLHYYFYFIDPELGLCFLRVPTWCPFQLQFYFNGHAWLASKLRAEGIVFTLTDNAFTALADFDRAQQLADAVDIRTLHSALDRFAALYCPVIEPLQSTYHWSLSQVEYATIFSLRLRRSSKISMMFSCAQRSRL